MVIKGMIVGNYKLTERIETFTELQNAIINEPSIFARHRMYPTAFINNWSFRLLNSWMGRGWLWIAEHVE